MSFTPLIIKTYVSKPDKIDFKTSKHGCSRLLSDKKKGKCDFKEAKFPEVNPMMVFLRGINWLK